MAVCHLQVVAVGGGAATFDKRMLTFANKRHDVERSRTI